MEDEVRLAGRAAGGDRAALGELLARHQDAAYALALAITGAGADAEDAAQNAYLRAVRDAGRYRPERAPFRAWLLALVRAAAIDVVRARSARARHEGSRAVEALRPAAEAGAGIGAAGAAETARAAQAALMALEARFRLPVFLHYVQGLSHAEVAAVLGEPPGTVAANISRGVERLREALGRAGYSCPAAAMLGLLGGLPRASAPASLAAKVPLIAAGQLQPAAPAAAAKGGTAMKIVLGVVLAGVLAGGTALLFGPTTGNRPPTTELASPPAGKPAEPVTGPPKLEHFAAAARVGYLDGPRLQALMWHHAGGAPDEKENLFFFSPGCAGFNPPAAVRCARVDGMVETIAYDNHWPGTRELDEGPASCLPAIHPSGGAAFGTAFVFMVATGRPLEGGDQGGIYLSNVSSGALYKIYRNKEKGNRWWFTRLGGSTPLPTEVGKTAPLKGAKAKGIVVGQDSFGVHLVSQGSYYALDEAKLTVTCLLSAADYRDKALLPPGTKNAGKPLGPAEDIVRTEDGSFFARYYYSAGVGCIFKISPDRSKVEPVLTCAGGNSEVPDGPGIGVAFGGGPFFASVEGNVLLLNPVDGARGRRLKDGRVSTLCADGEWREIPSGPDSRKPEFKTVQWFFQVHRNKGMPYSYLCDPGETMGGDPRVLRVGPVDWTKPTVGPKIREAQP